MSNETFESKWTFESLFEYFNSTINANEERTLEAFNVRDKNIVTALAAQKSAIDAALAAQKSAIEAALTAQERAVLKAENATEKRFEGVNEFRGQLADMIRTLMPRAESELRFGSLDKTVSDINTSVTAHHSEERGGSKGIYLVGMVFSIIIAILAVLDKLFIK